MKTRFFLRHRKEAEKQLQEEAQTEAPESPDVSPDGEDAQQEPEDQQAPSGLDTIKKFTQSEGVETHGNISLREILGGDIFMNGWLRRQMGLIVLCVVLAIIYITNRYSAEQEVIEIENLKVELTKIRYRALTRSSELTVKTRQSQVEEFLKHTPDSVLALPKEPPFLIKQTEE